MATKCMKLESKKLCFKPDADFRGVLEQSQEGVISTAAVMLLFCHRPGTARIDNVLRNVFKDPGRKRDYSSDLRCTRCGQRFEAKWKSRDGSYTVGPDLLRRYAADNAIVVFTYPSRIVAIQAQELWDRRRHAEYKVNRWNEPYLDFCDVHGIPVLLELKRKSLCRYFGG